MRGVLKKTAIILLSLCFCFVLLAVSSYIYMKISAPKAPESGAAENISARTEMPASETGIKTASAMEDMLETALESVVGILLVQVFAFDMETAGFVVSADVIGLHAYFFRLDTLHA